MIRRTVLALTTALLLLAPGCADEEKKPCPASGIGVNATDGTSCQKIIGENPTSPAAKDCMDQVEKFSEYDCTEPQICTDFGKLIVRSYLVDPKAPAESVTFLLTNCSGSNQKLLISKMVVVGDKRCAFSEPEIESREIAPGQGSSISLRILYQPKELGQDHAAIHLTTNAQNHGQFILPVCGRAVALYQPGMDSGPPGIDAGGPSVTPLDCQDVSSQGVNTSCHKE